MDDVKVELTDTEWMDLIDGERPDGLQKCCANISVLRDWIISLARDGGQTNFITLQELRRTLGWVCSDHAVDGIPALVKLRAQVGMEEPIEHEAMGRPESFG